MNTTHKIKNTTYTVHTIETKPHRDGQSTETILLATRTTSRSHKQFIVFYNETPRSSLQPVSISILDSNGHRVWGGKHGDDIREAVNLHMSK